MALLLRLSGGEEREGRVAVRSDGFSWCGRELWASPPHASVLCNRQNTEDDFQVKTHKHICRPRAFNKNEVIYKIISLPFHHTIQETLRVNDSTVASWIIAM